MFYQWKYIWIADMNDDILGISWCMLVNLVLFERHVKHIALSVRHTWWIMPIIYIIYILCIYHGSIKYCMVTLVPLMIMLFGHRHVYDKSHFMTANYETIPKISLLCIYIALWLFCSKNVDIICKRRRIKSPLIGSIKSVKIK